MSMLSVFTLNTHFMSYGKLPSFIFASVNKGLHDSIAYDNAHDKIYIYIHCKSTYFIDYIFRLPQLHRYDYYSRNATK